MLTESISWSTAGLYRSSTLPPIRLSVIPIMKSFPGRAECFLRGNEGVLIEQNRTVEYEEVAPHTDGPHTYISIKFPLCDHSGRPYAICGISTDITERTRIEHTLRIHEERLRRALTSTEM